jgi:hypothetical protein
MLRARWIRSYVEAVLVLDFEFEALDTVVDGRHFGEGGSVQVILPGLIRGALLVTEDRFGGTCLRHAAQHASRRRERSQRGVMRQESAGETVHNRKK